MHGKRLPATTDIIFFTLLHVYVTRGEELQAKNTDQPEGILKCYLDTVCLNKQQLRGNN